MLVVALLLWRLIERSLRQDVLTTETKLVGWDGTLTAFPTACMMMTKFAGVIVLKVGDKRQLAHELSPLQQHSLLALGLSATWYTLGAG